MTTNKMHGAARLTDWGVIRAEGEEAAKFLHSQLTQDFALLGLDQARFAGFCSAKGRLLATMIGWKVDANTVLLALPLDVLPAILKRLSMFVLRAKCKLSDASAQVPLWGVVSDAGDASRWSLTRDGEAVNIQVAPGLVLSTQAQAASSLSEAEWNWRLLEAGVPHVQAATVEQFVPQMLNLELLGGVNFQKGCYPGQEVVARSQYRGTLKRRSFLFDSAGAARPGQEVFHSGDASQPAGMVVNAASFEGHHAALVEVKLAALDGGRLHLGAADGPLLEREELPYALPLDAA